MVLLHRLAHSQEADEDVCGASPGLRGEGVVNYMIVVHYTRARVREFGDDFYT